MTEVRTTSSTGGQKGVKLARHSLIPAGPHQALAEHYGVGALKYEGHQWRQGYEVSKSYDAMQRHAVDWLAGKTYDTCSASNFEGCSHVDAEGKPFKAPREDACYNHTASHQMACVAWHSFAIQEFEDRFPEHDDRYSGPAEPEAAKTLCARCGDEIVPHHGNGGQWLGAHPPRDWAVCYGLVDGPKHTTDPFFIDE